MTLQKNPIIYAKAREPSSLSRIFMAYSMVALVVLGGSIYFAITSGISILLLCSMGGALLILGVQLDYWNGSLREAIRVELSDDVLRAFYRNNSSKEMRYQEIRICQRTRFTYRPVLQISSESDHVRINLPLEGSGQMIEAILATADGIQAVDLGNWPRNPAFWQKEPDWDTINAAITRAEANRTEKNKEKQ